MDIDIVIKKEPSSDNHPTHIFNDPSVQTGIAALANESVQDASENTQLVTSTPTALHYAQYTTTPSNEPQLHFSTWNMAQHESSQKVIPSSLSTVTPTMLQYSQFTNALPDGRLQPFSIISNMPQQEYSHESSILPSLDVRPVRLRSSTDHELLNYLAERGISRDYLETVDNHIAAEIKFIGSKKKHYDHKDWLSQKDIHSLKVYATGTPLDVYKLGLCGCEDIGIYVDTGVTTPWRPTTEDIATSPTSEDWTAKATSLTIPGRMSLLRYSRDPELLDFLYCNNIFDYILEDVDSIMMWNEWHLLNNPNIRSLTTQRAEVLVGLAQKGNPIDVVKWTLYHLLKNQRPPSPAGVKFGMTDDFGRWSLLSLVRCSEVYQPSGREEKSMRHLQDYNYWAWRRRLCLWPRSYAVDMSSFKRSTVCKLWGLKKRSHSPPRRDDIRGRDCMRPQRYDRWARETRSRSPSRRDEVSREDCRRSQRDDRRARRTRSRSPPRQAIVIKKDPCLTSTTQLGNAKPLAEKSSQVLKLKLDTGAQHNALVYRGKSLAGNIMDPSLNNYTGQDVALQESFAQLVVTSRACPEQVGEHAINLPKQSDEEAEIKIKKEDDESSEAKLVVGGNIRSRSIQEERSWQQLIEQAKTSVPGRSAKDNKSFRTSRVLMVAPATRIKRMESRLNRKAQRDAQLPKRLADLEKQLITIQNQNPGFESPKVRQIKYLALQLRVQQEEREGRLTAMEAAEVLKENRKLSKRQIGERNEMEHLEARLAKLLQD
ncbi:hypothetical protein MMC13_002370 [Lambiella insularis]|nr:hypothetical protein [Lambiella insularis]